MFLHHIHATSLSTCADGFALKLAIYSQSQTHALMQNDMGGSLRTVYQPQRWAPGWGRVGA